MLLGNAVWNYNVLEKVNKTQKPENAAYNIRRLNQNLASYPVDDGAFILLVFAFTQV